MPDSVISIEDPVLYTRGTCYYKYIEYGILYHFVDWFVFISLTLIFQFLNKQNITVLKSSYFPGKQIFINLLIRCQTMG